MCTKSTQSRHLCNWLGRHLEHILYPLALYYIHTTSDSIATLKDHLPRTKALGNYLTTEFGTPPVIRTVKLVQKVSGIETLHALASNQGLPRQNLKKRSGHFHTILAAHISTWLLCGSCCKAVGMWVTWYSTGRDFDANWITHFYVQYRCPCMCLQEPKHCMKVTRLSTGNSKRSEHKGKIVRQRTSGAIHRKVPAMVCRAVRSNDLAWPKPPSCRQRGHELGMSIKKGSNRFLLIKASIPSPTTV